MGLWHGTKDVFLQDQTSPLFHYFLMEELKTDITLPGGASFEDTDITVSAGHGFVIGDYCVIKENGVYAQIRVSNCAANVITVEVPLANDFSSNAQVIRGNINLKIDGSTTSKEFIFDSTGFTAPIDINKVLVMMVHNTESDDSLFGDVAAITKGLRFLKTNTQTIGLGNFKSNGDFKAYGARVEYADKAGGGKFSTFVEFILNGQQSYGQTIRMSSFNHDIAKAVVQDDLNKASIVSIQIALIGSFTVGE
jgi:hypothetical protein